MYYLTVIYEDRNLIKMLESDRVYAVDSHLLVDSYSSGYAIVKVLDCDIERNVDDKIFPRKILGCVEEMLNGRQ